MPSWLIVTLFSIGAVAFFMVGMSITLMVKGHFIDSEISTNKHMRSLDIKCAVQESRIDQEGVSCHDLGCHSNCAGCDIDHESYQESVETKAKTQKESLA
ncbi:MAG: hypothetical protein SNH13_01260 [Rikenellaceae bacterium]